MRWQAAGRFPKILSATRVEAPQEIRDLARVVVERLSPECPYDDERFIIKGYFKKYGALYQNLDFPCRNPLTQSFFTTALDSTNQDGLLTVSILERQY